MCGTAYSTVKEYWNSRNSRDPAIPVQVMQKKKKKREAKTKGWGFLFYNSN
jgi:hypothetical protein